MDITECLPQHASMTLNLSNRNITTINQLPSHSPFNKLKYLHLSHNRINNLGCIHQFTCLISLSLSNNQITDIQQLQSASKTIEHLTIHSNPLQVYDYNDICYDIFPKLKRLDGLPVDRKYIALQRRHTQIVSRWLIPYLLYIEQTSEQLDKILMIRSLVHPTSKQLVTNDVLLQPDWQKIDEQLQFLRNPTISQLASNITCNLPQELDDDTTRQYKSIHYETFKSLIKHQSANNYTAFIDYLLTIQNDDNDTYQTFIKAQKPQVHIADDLYPKSERTVIPEPTKLQQQVPDHLRGKLSKLMISNTYTKVRTLPYHEQQEFYQYFPIYPFRVEYIQSIIDIVAQKLTSIKNQVKQIVQIQTSNPTTVRTQRIQPLKSTKITNNNSQRSIKPSNITHIDPATLPPQQTEEEKPTYEVLRQAILKRQKLESMLYTIQKLYDFRKLKALQRLQNPSLPDSLYLDFPMQHYLSRVFNVFKQALLKQRNARIKFNQLKLLTTAFIVLKQYKRQQSRDLDRIKQGLRKINQHYLKSQLLAFRQFKQLMVPHEHKRKPKQFQLLLEDAPLFNKREDIHIHTLKKEQRVNSFSNCSVCNYNQ